MSKRKTRQAPLPLIPIPGVAELASQVFGHNNSNNDHLEHAVDKVAGGLDEMRKHQYELQYGVAMGLGKISEKTGIANTKLDHLQASVDRYGERLYQANEFQRERLDADRENRIQDRRLHEEAQKREERIRMADIEARRDERLRQEKKDERDEKRQEDERKRAAEKQVKADKLQREDREWKERQLKEERRINDELSKLERERMASINKQNEDERKRQQDVEMKKIDEGNTRFYVVLALFVAFAFLYFSKFQN